MHSANWGSGTTGPSGAIRCSRPRGRRWAATTSGASAFPCRPPAIDTQVNIWQFIHAYEADYDPTAQGHRPEDYYDNAVTIDWPAGAYGQPLAIETALNRARGPQGRRARRGRQGVRTLPGRRGLARALPQLLRRARAAADAEAARGAVLARPRRPAPHALGHAASDPAALLQLCGCLRRLAAQQVAAIIRKGGDPWPEAVHRVAADGISPEQAVDEAIARIKEILSE